MAEIIEYRFSVKNLEQLEQKTDILEAGQKTQMRQF